MKCFLPIIFLLGISRNVLGKGIRIERSNNEDELSYQELINMNVSCYPWDSCTEDRTDDSPVPEDGEECSCHSQCWEYGTCCIDSPYRVKPPIQKCVVTNSLEVPPIAYYMVHRCPDNTHPDSIWRSNCERNVDEMDDILKISPVTSLDTLRTYRNYYCFRCHETTDKYESWNLELMVKRSETTNHGMTNYSRKEDSIYSVAFNKTEKHWVAILDESHTSRRALLFFEFPDDLHAEPMACDDSNVISDCFRRDDERLRAKCLSYRATVYKSCVAYRNVHCALCRGVSLDELICHRSCSVLGAMNFSNFYRCLTNKNDNDKGKKCFKKEDKPETCKGDYEFWNSYTKKCEKISCPEAGYVLKNDICVKP